MDTIQACSSLSPAPPVPRRAVSVAVAHAACVPERVVEQLADIEGPLEVYTWYDGPQGMPVSGAVFLRREILAPLYNLKPDAHVSLYSLQGWDFAKPFAKLSLKTPLAECINSVDRTAVQCLSAGDYFRYCRDVAEDSPMAAFARDRLLQKTWLLDLSRERKPSTCTLGKLFDDQASLFSFMHEWNAAKTYSAMQYMEGIYLIEEAIKKGLDQGQNEISIAFVLPNDEGKYYRDYELEVPTLIEEIFGDRLQHVSVNVVFLFYLYGETPKARPYIDTVSAKIRADEVDGYFDYLARPRPFLRDVIHNLN